MTVNSHAAGPDGRHAGTVSKYAIGVFSIAARIGTKAQSVLKSLQMARMLSTLSSMSDHQLAQMGIERSEIPKYAQTLMAKE